MTKLLAFTKCPARRITPIADKCDPGKESCPASRGSRDKHPRDSKHELSKTTAWRRRFSGAYGAISHSIRVSLLFRFSGPNLGHGAHRCLLQRRRSSAMDTIAVLGEKISPQDRGPALLAPNGRRAVTLSVQHARPASRKLSNVFIRQMRPRRTTEMRNENNGQLRGILQSPRIGIVRRTPQTTPLPKCCPTCPSLRLRVMNPLSQTGTT